MPFLYDFILVICSRVTSCSQFDPKTAAVFNSHWFTRSNASYSGKCCPNSVSPRKYISLFIHLHCFLLAGMSSHIVLNGDEPLIEPAAVEYSASPASTLGDMKTLKDFFQKLKDLARLDTAAIGKVAAGTEFAVSAMMKTVLMWKQAMAPAFNRLHDITKDPKFPFPAPNRSEFNAAVAMGMLAMTETGAIVTRSISKFAIRVRDLIDAYPTGEPRFYPVNYCGLRFLECLEALVELVDAHASLLKVFEVFGPQMHDYWRRCEAQVIALKQKGSTSSA